MGPPFAVCIVLLAICVNLVVSTIYRFSKHRDAEDAPTIFVVLVSYRDAGWPKQVEQLLASAKYPSKLSFGVIEYVERAEDTAEPYFAHKRREQVRVHALSHLVATTLSAARQVCLTELYQDEQYVLLLRSVHAAPNWDVQLAASQAPGSVITLGLSTKSSVPTFPCLSFHDGGRVDVQHREVHASVGRPPASVPVLIWQPDVSFSTKPIADLVVQSDNSFEISALLDSKGHVILGMTSSVGVRSTYMRGIRVGACSVRTELDQRFAAKLGSRDRSVAIYTKLGLTASPSTEEKVLKYGSVLAVRVAVQTLEAGAKT